MNRKWLLSWVVLPTLVGFAITLALACASALLMPLDITGRKQAWTADHGRIWMLERVDTTGGTLLRWQSITGYKSNIGWGGKPASNEELAQYAAQRNAELTDPARLPPYGPPRIPDRVEGKPWHRGEAVEARGWPFRAFRCSFVNDEEALNRWMTQWSTTISLPTKAPQVADADGWTQFNTVEGSGPVLDSLWFSGVEATRRASEQTSPPPVPEKVADDGWAIAESTYSASPPVTDAMEFTGQAPPMNAQAQESPVVVSIAAAAPLPPVIIKGAVQLPFEARATNPLTGTTLLAYQPIWPGLLANTATFACAWILLAPGRAALVRSRRRYRGRCPACGYDLKSAGSCVCPECGLRR